ncbi:MAG: sulfatase [Bacteroidia bacterium]|nr:sulfatase [Bacteroidia bacterium]
MKNRIIFISGIIAAWGCNNAKSAEYSKPAHPNVLFIAVDDLNDWVGYLGERDGIVTPNLDRLAGKGCAFTNCMTASPVSHPSRVAIMTGVHPLRSGIAKNVYKKKSASWREGPDAGNQVLKNVVTLSQQFRNHGYYAAGGGKIFHALQWSDGTENDPGTWDYYFPDALATIPFQVRPQDLVDDSFAGLTPNRPNGGTKDKQYFGAHSLPIEDSVMSDYKVVDWAISELNKKHEKPFFLACGVFRPHMPWEVPQKYFDIYPLDKIQRPLVLENDLADAHDHTRKNWQQWVLENNVWEKFLQGYQSSITFSDAMVGRLLKAFDKSKYAKNTIIVLWSDNGMHMGEKQNWEKFTLWEESCRVPLIICVPWMRNSITRVDQSVSTIDIYPTLCDLCGFETPADCDGKSLVPYLKGDKSVEEVPAMTTYRAEMNGDGIKLENYRYIRYTDGFEELYDHSKDPNEWTNLSENPEYATVKQKLSNWLDATDKNYKEKNKEILKRSN